MTDNYNDRYIMPFSLGNELSTESFKIAQYDNTYLLAAPRYYQFYASYIRPRMLMYSGWMEGFHNVEYGIIPSLFLQKIGNGVASTIFGKPIVLNTQDKQSALLRDGKFKKTNFSSVVKEAYKLCIAGGTSLIKINRDGEDNLKFEAIPMDKFFIETDAYGEIERVKCFIATYHDTITAAQEYYLCEERFFRYATIGGVRKRFAMVHYTFYKTSSNIVNELTPRPTESIIWSDIPREVQNLLTRDYGEIYLDDYDSITLEEKLKNARGQEETVRLLSRCKLLPFHDDLGCRMLKFTENIPSFPKIPFGQPLADLLMNEAYAYDQLKFFERMEVYIARGRIMLDEGTVNPNDPEARKSAFDPAVFTSYSTMMGDVKDGKPTGIQLDLRSENIKGQKQNILNDTAFSLNLSSSTIAAWLSDGTTQKTATEIEYERTKTESFINEKIDLIQEPLQDILDMYFNYYGLSSPQINIMPENQTARTDNIKLFSDLYKDGQVTAKMLAEKILGTCSVKEVTELAEYINHKQTQSQPLPQLETPQSSGVVESPVKSVGEPK